MKKNNVLLLLSLLFLGGCADFKPVDQMKPSEMFGGPNFVSDPPDVVTFVLYPLPEEMDVPDTFLDDLDEVAPSKTWWVMLIDGSAADVKKVQKLPGIRVKIPGIEKPMLQVAIPNWYKEVQKSFLVPVDHTVTAYADSRGKLRRVKNWDEFNPASEVGVSRIEDLTYSEEIKGSEEYAFKMSVYKDYIYEIQEEYTDLMWEMNTYLGREKNNLVYSLNGSELAYVKKNEELVSKLRKFFGKDWAVMVTMPFIGATNTVINVFVTKLFKIPEVWNPQLDFNGSRHRALTAASGYRMNKYRSEEYGLGDKREAKVKKLVDSLSDQDLDRLVELVKKR